MEQITLGEIALALAFLAGLAGSIIGGVKMISSSLKKWILKGFDERFIPMKNELDALKNRVEDVDMETCKNFLVRFLADVEKGEQIDEIERERFYEQFEHYTSKGGNSYIRQKFEKLHRQGRL